VADERTLLIEQAMALRATRRAMISALVGGVLIRFGTVWHMATWNPAI
jgi:hypothetical protein